MREKILETVNEVMSQRQFQFEEESYYLSQSFLPDFSLVFGLLILSAGFISILMLLIRCLKRLFKKTQVNPLETIKEEKIVSLPSNPIEKLHAEFLISLHNRGKVTIHKWKTNSDYVLECKNPIFHKVCQLHDAVFYGAKEVSATSVSLLIEEFEAWEKQYD